MSRIQIRLVDLVLEANSRCRFDALTVYDGVYGSENWNATNRYCVSYITIVIFNTEELKRIRLSFLSILIL